MSARSRRSARAAASGAAATQRARAGATRASISAGRPSRQSSQGRNW